MPKNETLVPFPKGRDKDGHEWVVFQLYGGGSFPRVSEDDGPRVIHSVTICIPRLPHGPLSVRKFFVEAIPSGRRSELLTTLDCDGEQKFALFPPLEARWVRVCFCENAAGARPTHQAIGLWHIRFE